MSIAPNLFLGSVDRVLTVMSAHLDVAAVIAPRGRLRNLRLQHSLRERGTEWIEVADRADYLAAMTAFPQIGSVAVAGFSWRITRPIIERSHLVVNFHPGDILRNRGPQPLEASLVQGFDEVAATAHLIDSEQFDSGPILHRVLAPVNPGRGFNWHKRLSGDLLETVAEHVFAALAEGGLPEAAAWDVAASHWYEREPADVLKALYAAPSLEKFYAARRVGNQA